MTDYVTIERADNEAIAEMIRQRLEESGIPCAVAPGNMGAFAGAGASYTRRSARRQGRRGARAAQRLRRSERSYRSALMTAPPSRMIASA